jgi:hypothetical protein
MQQQQQLLLQLVMAWQKLTRRPTRLQLQQQQQVEPSPPLLQPDRSVPAGVLTVQQHQGKASQQQQQQQSALTRGQQSGAVRLPLVASQGQRQQQQQQQMGTGGCLPWRAKTSTCSQGPSSSSSGSRMTGQGLQGASQQPMQLLLQQQQQQQGRMQQHAQVLRAGISSKEGLDAHTTPWRLMMT